MLETSEAFNFREAADALGIEPWRLSRLARYLGIDPGEKCIPREQIDQFSHESLAEDRYGTLRQWVLQTVLSQRAG